MARRCAACSIAPLLGNRNRNNTSVRITIHSFVFTAGSQTCACWRSRKLNRFRPLRFHIRSSSVSSEQSGGSTLIGYFFGTPRTWRASCTITKCITTRIESIVRSAARPPRYAPAYPQLFQPRLTVTRGSHIAAVCFRLRSPPDLYFATHRQALYTSIGWLKDKGGLHHGGRLLLDYSGLLPPKHGPTPGVGVAR